MLSATHKSLRERAMITLCIVVVLAVVAVVYAYWFLVQGEDQEKRGQRQLQMINKKIASAQDSVDLLISYQDQFLEFLAGGVVGTEQRLSWIETLKSSSLRYRIPKTSYRIEARERVEPNKLGIDSAVSSALPLYHTRMDLEMDVLHEGEILALLTALQRDAKGVFTTQKCSFTRTGERLNWDLSANFRVMCFLDWYTIEHPRADVGNS